MEVTSLYKDTLKALDQLEDTEHYQKRKSLIEEYAAITKEISAQTNRINDLIEQEKFDEAVEVKDKISLLEKKAGHHAALIQRTGSRTRVFGRKPH